MDEESVTVIELLNSFRIPSRERLPRGDSSIDHPEDCIWGGGPCIGDAALTRAYASRVLKSTANFGKEGTFFIGSGALGVGAISLPLVS